MATPTAPRLLASGEASSLSGLTTPASTDAAVSPLGEGADRDLHDAEPPCYGLTKEERDQRPAFVRWVKYLASTLTFPSHTEFALNRTERTKPWNKYPVIDSSKHVAVRTAAKRFLAIMIFKVAITSSLVSLSAPLLFVPASVAVQVLNLVTKIGGTATVQFDSIQSPIRSLGMPTLSIFGACIALAQNPIIVQCVLSGVSIALSLSIIFMHMVDVRVSGQSLGLIMILSTYSAHISSFLMIGGFWVLYVMQDGHPYVGKIPPSAVEYYAQESNFTIGLVDQNVTYVSLSFIGILFIAQTVYLCASTSRTANFYYDLHTPRCHRFWCTMRLWHETEAAMVCVILGTLSLAASTLLFAVQTGKLSPGFAPSITTDSATSLALILALIGALTNDVNEARESIRTDRKSSLLIRRCELYAEVRMPQLNTIEFTNIMFDVVNSIDDLAEVSRLGLLNFETEVDLTRWTVIELIEMDLQTPMHRSVVSNDIHYECLQALFEFWGRFAGWTVKWENNQYMLRPPSMEDFDGELGAFGAFHNSWSTTGETQDEKAASKLDKVWAGVGDSGHRKPLEIPYGPSSADAKGTSAPTDGSSSSNREQNPGKIDPEKLRLAYYSEQDALLETVVLTQWGRAHEGGIPLYDAFVYGLITNGTRTYPHTRHSQRFSSLISDLRNLVVKVRRLPTGAPENKAAWIDILVSLTQVVKAVSSTFLQDVPESFMVPHMTIFVLADTEKELIKAKVPSTIATKRVRVCHRPHRTDTYGFKRELQRRTTREAHEAAIKRTSVLSRAEAAFASCCNVLCCGPRSGRAEEEADAKAMYEMSVVR